MQNLLHRINSSRKEAHIAVDRIFDNLEKDLSGDSLTDFYNPDLPTSKFEWLKSKIILKIFFDLLFQNHLLRCEFETFKSHFEEGIKITKHIIWYGNANELVYLLHRLYDEGIILKPSFPNKRIQEHFLNQSRREISLECLRSSLNKGVRKAERLIMLDGIVVVLLNHSNKS
ncbi:MAG: hypothetical protein HY841_08865 [Bacteroidetes bacterium]|nr:hypothetical protein [Bacteroidota bacterium]